MVYLRVSTDKQGRSGLGLEGQRETIAAYLRGMGETRSPGQTCRIDLEQVTALPNKMAMSKCF